MEWIVSSFAINFREVACVGIRLQPQVEYYGKWMQADYLSIAQQFM